MKRLPNILYKAAVFEGLTLLLLIFVAVPVKRLGGYPGLVQLIGPIHGLAFLAYIYQLLSLRGQGVIDTKRLLGWSLASFVPFGTFYILPKAKS